MFKVFDVDIIPFILDAFKVNNVVLSGLSDEKIVKIIFDYCSNNDVPYVAIDSKEYIGIDSIKDYTLNVLPTLSDFDAIFINDDANWYTVFNELNCIKKVNAKFPLIFICNDVFPNKYRDSYINPEIIPNEYLNDFSLKLPINEDICIEDGFYHAIVENTPKNGVSVAISDFLSENLNIGVMDLKLLNGITILYSMDSINHIRFNKLCNSLDNHDLELDMSDEMIKNQILVDFISNFDISESDIDLISNLRLKVVEKDKIIDNFEYKINLTENELDYKDSQIQETNHKLNLKDSKIRDLESKLLNKNNEILSINNSLEQANDQIKVLKNDFNIQINNANSQINSLKKNISEKENDFNVKEEEFNNQINIIKQQNKSNEDKLSAMDSNISYKNIQIRIKDAELLDKSNQLTQLKNQSNDQIVKLENNEYCISCYKEEIENNNLEIQYLKNNNLTKRFLSLFEFVVLIFKSRRDEIPINYQLYKALKNSKCFDVGYYLNKNKDVFTSNWCKYFSPELHYVCNGFDERRKFNKKYFNINSKKELLEYILNCNY